VLGDKDKISSMNPHLDSSTYNFVNKPSIIMITLKKPSLDKFVIPDRFNEEDKMKLRTCSV